MHRSAMSLAAAALIVGAGTLVSSTGASAGEACSFYEHRDFMGWSIDVYDGEAIRFVGERRNDRISSIACDPGCQAIVFEHAKFKGQALRVRRDVVFVGNRWNDRISSLQVSCRF